jgi:hypothetical protein
MKWRVGMNVFPRPTRRPQGCTHCIHSSSSYRQRACGKQHRTTLQRRPPRALSRAARAPSARGEGRAERPLVQRLLRLLRLLAPGRRLELRPALLVLAHLLRLLPAHCVRLLELLPQLRLSGGNSGRSAPSRQAWVLAWGVSIVACSFGGGRGQSGSRMALRASARAGTLLPRAAGRFPARPRQAAAVAAPPAPPAVRRAPSWRGAAAPPRAAAPGTTRSGRAEDAGGSRGERRPTRASMHEGAGGGRAAHLA